MTTHATLYGDGRTLGFLPGFVTNNLCADAKERSPLTRSRPMTREAKMRHCWYCGAEIGIYADWRPSDLDDCGSPECQRETRAAFRAEREEAHDRLDEDMNW